MSCKFFKKVYIIFITKLQDFRRLKFQLPNYKTLEDWNFNYQITNITIIFITKLHVLFLLKELEDFPGLSLSKNRLYVNQLYNTDPLKNS